ncbi:hypothetical protein LCGC14_0919910 [marine sediment metagenome]|uniref:Uncharacterized protein n=1 Tax=marine sediment metagenome TaxID=412755 RepID=A0A0F9R9V5_9ZZZZ
MYTSHNFRTKAALKQAVKAGEHVSVFQPGPFPPPTDGTVSLEGPHFPTPHTWYATAEIQDGVVVKVR